MSENPMTEDKGMNERQKIKALQRSLNLLNEARDFNY